MFNYDITFVSQYGTTKNEGERIMHSVRFWRLHNGNYRLFIDSIEIGDFPTLHLVLIRIANHERQAA